MFSVSPFKKVQKSFSKTLQRASDFLSSVGPSPTKSLRSAILSCDEDKAIEIYLTEVNGSSLQYDLHVSLPFPIKAYDDQTPMHLATLKALENLIKLFLEHNGNPNALNSNFETCLHSLCQESNQDIKRQRILNLFLEWRGYNELGEEEVISINRVDNDGNTPLHYASKNGLMECILSLTAHNAIISIVNKDQMTCCEIAEANNHIEMADILEIALIFPPPDQDIVIYDDDETRRYQQQVSSIKPFFLCDSQTYPFETLDKWREDCIECAKDALTLPKNYIEVILDHFNWDLEQTLEEMLVKKDEILEQLHLTISNHLPITYMIKNSISSNIEMEQDIANLDDIFIDVDQKVVITNNINENNHNSLINTNLVSNNIIHVNDINETIGTCSICGDDMYPTLNSKDLLDKSLLYHGQREIRCGSGHSYCSTCWGHHWTLQINDNSAPFLSCMAYKCGEILSSNDWAIPVLGEVLAEKLKTNRLRRIVDSSSKFRWCPSKDCNSILCINSINESSLSNTKLSTELSTSTPEKSQPQLPQSAICGNGHSFCLICNGESHAPCSCEHWISWTEKIQREISEAEGAKSDSGIVDVASALWVAANTKKCPRCQTPIEKNEGCNHMTCRKCRYEFCWICFQDWEKHSNRTGGYFQCTIYAGNNPNENGPDDETPRIDPNDDFGNASTEAYRARERANLMDRFINHYTRFRAHSDSLILELNMHATNLNRIRNSLHSTAIGSTPWLQGSSINHPYNLSNNLKDSKDPLSTNSNNEDCLCSDEEIDKSLIYCGDWDEPKESPLLFLQRGFRELIKCRQILKGSFPFSFYMMPEESLNTRWGSYDYESAQRKVYAESRVKVFLEMQSELESLTETLSDVVARRRLRASANQIARATFAARARRLDFESVIKRHYEAYSQDKLAESRESQNRSSRNSSRRRSGASSSSRSAFRHTLHEEDDSIDRSLQHLIDSLRESGLAEDDISAADFPAFRRSISNRRTQMDDLDTLMPAHARITRQPPSRRSTRDNNSRRIPEEDPLAFLNTPSQPTSSTSASSSGRSIRQELIDAGWTDNDIQREGFSDEPVESPREYRRRVRQEARNLAISSRSPSIPRENNENENETASAAPVVSPNQINDLDDEEDINRAILMSLQQREPIYASVERPEPSSELVQLLTDMGFSRDTSIQALKDYGENIEDAIMYLTTR